MAYGDPRFLGYLAAATFNHGFPEYARPFYAAFLSLPALPSRIANGVSSDPEVVVRVIPTQKHGTYLSIVNVGLTAKRGVTIRLPEKVNSRLTDAATARPLKAENNLLRLDMEPCSLHSVRIQ